MTPPKKKSWTRGIEQEIGFLLWQDIDGVDGILVKHTKRKFTDEFKNEVLKHVDNGEPLDSIALMFNIKHSTINSLNKKRNEIKDNKITSPLTNEERKELIELRKKKQARVFI